MCSCHSILECCVTFSGVKLSIRSFVLFLFAQKEIIPKRNQPNRQFKKILKISLRFIVTTNQSFREIEVLGEIFED